MEMGTIYIPIEQKPIFGFRKAEKPLCAEGFLLTSCAINNLIPVGNPLLVILGFIFLIVVVLIAAAIDIVLFLIIKNFFAFLWSVITDSASGILGKFARIVGIAAGVFLIYVFITSKAYIQCASQLKSLLGW